MSSSGTVCGSSPRGRRPEERLGDTEQDLDRDQLPDRHRAGEDQHGEEPVKPEPDQVGDDHQAVAGKPVSPDPADHQEGHQGDRVRGEDDPEVGGASGQVDHEQGDRHGDDGVAEPARRLGQPEEAEVAVAQDAQRSSKSCHCADSLKQPAPIAAADNLRRCCSARSSMRTSPAPPTWSATRVRGSRRSSTRSGTSIPTCGSAACTECGSSTCSRPTTTPTTSPATGAWPGPPAPSIHVHELAAAEYPHEAVRRRLDACSWAR